MKSAEFSCGRLGFGMEKYIKQKKKEKNTENIKKEVVVGKGVVGHGPQTVLSGARGSADDCLAMKCGLRRSDSAFSSSGAGKISRIKARRAIGRTFPLFIVCMLFCMSFAIIGVNAATRASDLAVWQTLWDSWNIGSASCQYGNLDGCTRGDPCGTCTGTDGSTKNIQCTSTADGNAITVLRIYTCGLSGTCLFIY